MNPVLGKDMGNPPGINPIPLPLPANTAPIWLRVWVHDEKISGLS